MQRASTHRDLVAWQRALDFVEAIYALTESFPKQEIFGLTSQLRRAVVSIPSNIAEGAARRSSKEFVQFLSIATGSLAEIETQLEIARRLGLFAADHQVIDMHAEVSRLVVALRRSIQARVSQVN